MDPAITGLLKVHGIKIEQLAADSRLEVQQFDIIDLKGSTRLNQGHYTNSITGKFSDGLVTFPAGTLVVRTAQPFGNVAAYLLEPQSNDGMVFWNFFDRYLVPQWGQGYNQYPVYKVLNKTEIKTKPVL
jgi:hypothetical protein